MKQNINILDCTLRDGGIAIDFDFGRETINNIIHNLCLANIEWIEIGYLNSNRIHTANNVIFNNILQINSIIQDVSSNIHFVGMCDVGTFDIRQIEPYKQGGVSGIRIAFYKNQIVEALEYAQAFQSKGYSIYIQPMVTGTYSDEEYTNMCRKFISLKPDGMAIVDSFGYMDIEMFDHYYNILNSLLPKDKTIFFHSHNNTNQSLLISQHILSDIHDRQIVIDASLLGMGKCAGNLQLEHIACLFNKTLQHKYDEDIILDTIAKYIAPLKENYQWGTNFYYYVTAKNRMHANYATFYLQCVKERFGIITETAASDFLNFIKMISNDMINTCKKQYVAQMFETFINQEIP